MKNSEGWWYRNTDGTYPANTWQMINGAWYLFGYDGYILTGWQLKDGRYYYLDSNGAMPVSYTHLDVYKRQADGCGRRHGKPVLHRVCRP